MHAGKRRSLPPWDRRPAQPRHPTGRARRRWPRAYDGGEPPVNRRYRDALEQDRRTERRRGSRQRSAFEKMRQSPVRSGLLGLAVAGTAAPIAVNSYQQAMRTDPTHEASVKQSSGGTRRVSDAEVTDTWRTMEAQRTAAGSQREAFINEKLAQYSDFGLTRELAESIYDMAAQAEVEPDVAFGLVRAESSFKNSATSHVGAVGLTQLMPNTARWLEPGITRAELRDPDTNLRIGLKYLRQLIDKYDGNTSLALTAYNRGPGTVDRVLKRGGNPDNGYADFVRSGNVGRHKG